MRRIFRRLLMAVNLVRRERKVAQRVEEQASLEDRLALAESRVRRYARGQKIWFWAFIFSTCIGLGFWKSTAVQTEARINAEVNLLSQAAMREEFRDLFSDIRDNVRTMPLWAVGLWKGWRGEEVKAGHIEWEKNQVEKQLSQCWVQYDKLRASIDGLTNEVEKKNLRIDQLESDTWSGQVNAKSRTDK